MGIKSLELKPTRDNLIKTLKGNTIERNDALKRFIKICNLIDEGYSISIDGKWGDGKTFFVKQAKLVLDALNPNCENDLSDEERSAILSIFMSDNDSNTFESNPQICVYYDAWANDNDVDPLSADMQPQVFQENISLKAFADSCKV